MRKIQILASTARVSPTRESIDRQTPAGASNCHNLWTPIYNMEHQFEQFYKQLYCNKPILKFKTQQENLVPLISQKCRARAKPLNLLAKSHFQLASKIDPQRQKLKSMAMAMQYSLDQFKQNFQNQDLPRIKLPAVSPKLKYTKTDKALFPRHRFHSQQKYYNRWYMPPNYKFIRKQKASNFKVQLKRDPAFFYKNIGNLNVWENVDPFAKKQMSKHKIEDKLFYSKSLIKLKTQIMNKGQRIPIFLRLYFDK